MFDRDKLQETGERLLSGGAQGVAEQGIPAVAGLILATLGPKGLRRLAYGKPPTGSAVEQSMRIFNLANELEQAHGKQVGVPTPDIEINTNKSINPGYIPAKKGRMAKVILPFNAPEETIAHEFGHAFPKSKAGKALRRAGILAGNKWTKGLPSAIAALGALSREDEGIASTVSKAAPYVGGAQLATILANEAGANLRGAKLLELAGRKIPISKKIRMFLPTTSYLGHTATLIGLPLGITKGIEAYRKSKEKGQKIKPKELLHATPEQIASLQTYEQFKKKWGDTLKKMR